MQDLVREHGYTFCKYKVINFFEVLMITIIFVCVIDVILDVMYSKYEANTDSQQGVGKVCRATIVEK